MNKQLQQHTRDTLKKGIAQLPENSHMLFKRMYSPENLDMLIDEVIDNMPEDKLDWAMQQVQRSLNKKKGDK